MLRWLPSSARWLRELFQISAACWSLASLSVVVCYRSYRVATGKPELQFINGNIAASRRTLVGYWHNTGKMVALDGRARLFEVDDHGKRAEQPFGDVKIIGTGSKVLPGFGANMAYRFTTDKFPKRILVCATYFDDNQKSYEQVYLLTVQDAEMQPLVLIEKLLPLQRNCH